MQEDSLEDSLNETLIPINIGTTEENVPLLVSYKTKVKNSTTIIIEGIETDQNGTANFILHDEKIESEGRIRIELDISEIKQILGSKDFDEYQEAVKELQQIIFKQVINFEFKKPENKIKREKNKKEPFRFLSNKLTVKTQSLEKKSPIF